MSHSRPLIVLPRPLQEGGSHSIAAPSESDFKAQFGSSLLPAHFLSSGYGTTAYYKLPPQNATQPQSPDSPTHRLILIHGTGTPAIGLTALARTLQVSNPRLHILLYDLWGHGLSSTPLVPHVPALFHFQILHLLGHVRWPSAHVVGYSFGGVTAVSLAAFHPELVESLAVIAPTGLIHSDGLTEVERLQMIGGDRGVEEAARDWALDFTNGGPLVIPEDWRERVNRGEVAPEAIKSWERNEHRGHVASVVAICRDGKLFDGHEAFRTVARSRRKTLAVLGELDDVCTVQDLEAVEWRNVVVVKGANHGLVRDHVSDVAALLQEFWASLA